MNALNLIVRRDDLLYIYEWGELPPEDVRLSGDPDSVPFRRHQGYEMLAFLNRVCTSSRQAQLAERLINSQAPRELKTRAQVLRWLQDNWPLVAK